MDGHQPRAIESADAISYRTNTINFVVGYGLSRNE